MFSQLVTLKVAGHIAYPLSPSLCEAYKHKQVHVYLLLKLLRISETVTC